MNFPGRMEAGEEIFISLKLYDVGIVGNKHIIYGVFLNVTEPKQLEWELEKYRLLLSGKTKDRGDGTGKRTIGGMIEKCVRYWKN